MAFGGMIFVIDLLDTWFGHGQAEPISKFVVKALVFGILNEIYDYFVTREKWRNRQTS